ncbi:MAG TPA: mechanosensitive ion channel domain-containing protein [Terriglobales bacterium]|nr:mechanosensitive ion channel domain-containing protein [Terriglobales bacterium]
MKTRQWIVVFALSALIVAAVVGLFLTRESSSPAAQARPRRAPLVDERPVQTARSLAALASTREEQRFAHQALRLADHAVDLAFADAMREATLHPLVPTPETKELYARVSRAEAQVKFDQDMIDELKKEPSGPHGSSHEIQHQLDLVQAQLELDKDDLEDAKGDLFRSGADPLSRIQRQFARYQAAQQQSDTAQSQLTLPATAATAPADNLMALFSVWRAQRDKAVLLQQARDEALQKREQLQEKHDSAEQPATAQPSAGQSQEPPPGADSSQAVVASLRRLSERQKELADLDKRMQDHQDLADVYGSWLAVVQSRQQAATHGFIWSVLLILLVVLGIYLADRVVEHLFTHLTPDRRRLRTLRVVVRFVVQAVGVLLILFVLFGMPSQMPTILGLAGAGLTVALKDFIVAFFGWFALMGRNGIRVGDWVEINGVVGEVAEIGLLRTVLLETGNWTDAGHPTGRKVAFVNSFAIEGHFFNFSTSGQWLWDELQIMVPSAQNPYPIIDAIQKLVTTATESNARMAEEEWQRATRREGMQAVSAAPAINLRPTTSGVEVHVRYITRANERYATRTKLYQEIVALLHQRQSEPAPAGNPVGAST